MQLSWRVFKIFFVILHIFLISSELRLLKAETWIRAGYYWYLQKEFPISNIDSSLFTHLICGFAGLNSTSYELSLSPFDENHFSAFTRTVKQQNPSVTTLLSIGGRANYSTFSAMVSSSSYRKSFIDSSIKTARLYGFQGLDLWWTSQNLSSSDFLNMGFLFKEWRATIDLEARSSSQPRLILTAVVTYSPKFYSGRYPVESMKRYLNWIHISPPRYFLPTTTNFTSASAALYNPTSDVSTDSGIGAWINIGLPAKKLVMCLPYYGYAWKLVNSNENGIGAPSTGPAMSLPDGVMIYTDIRDYVERYGANITYNATYVVNYCTIGTSWIGFDDIEAIRTKVSYAKEKGLLGYYVWQVSYDYNWVLSQAAADKEDRNKFSAKEHKNGRSRWRRSLVIILTTVGAVVLLFCCVVYYRRMRKLRFKGSTLDSVKESENNVSNITVH